MKTKLLLSMSLLFLIFSFKAQPRPEANLTIFSEDGLKFTLFLNGEQQNTLPQTNLRVEDLPQPYYTAKIVFEDLSKPEINKNNLMLTNSEGVVQDVTYRIKQDKNTGKTSLKFYSMIPIVQNYVAPANVVVVQHGTPAPVTNTTNSVGTGTTVTQTTTTTTGVGNASNVNTNIGGVNMNITINDPLMNQTTQTTTTQTTTYSTNQNTNNAVNTQQAQVGCNGSSAMLSSDFSAALTTIKNQGFNDTKLSTAKQIAKNNCLNTTQISSICKEFGFEETKLDFAKFAYDHCVEQKNYFNVNNVFGFSSSVDELNLYIEGR